LRAVEKNVGSHRPRRLDAAQYKGVFTLHL
jgi:hypothetical protein